MVDVRIQIFYGRDSKLDYILVNDDELDCSAIKEKPIEVWFEPSNGRDGWEGLIQEVKNMIHINWK